MRTLKALAITSIFALFSGCSTLGDINPRKPWDDLILYPRGEIVRATVLNKENTWVHFCGKLYDYNPYQLVLKIAEYDEELYEETRDVSLWQKPIHIRAENDYLVTIRKENLKGIKPCSPSDSRPRYNRNGP